MPDFPLNCIMIVDDSEIDRFVAESFVRQFKIANTILVFKTGVEAIDHLKEMLNHQKKLTFPELILLDLTMPQMDGINFLEEYGALALTEIPICILTASILQTDQEETRRFKCVKAFILKPLTEVSLLNLRLALDSN